MQAKFPLEQRLSTLANAVQGSYNQVRELTYLRTALKYSFTLTLSLVLLISLLASVYGAFFFSRRLVTPIQLLMQGTRAVARGDFATRVPTPARDEIGFLVHSFNDMTQRLARASEDALQSQQQVERERRKLEVILARLSTGVVSLEPDLRIRTANQAASAILGVNLETHVGESIVQARARASRCSDSSSAWRRAHLQGGDREWREQIMLRAEGGRRVLMCACTELPGDTDSPNGYAIVFDDITALLQAQRDAAWGEVARRLAHEIKNPLTPIQLSAERLRRKYLKPDSGEAELLDRATHTIIQQVEAMKQMVNAFSEYARTPRMEITRFDVNALITELCDLYAHQEKPLAITLSLSRDLPPIEADAGRLRQVLHNLLRNSLEAMEHQDEARVEISTRRISATDSELVEIRVADNGPGFLRDIVHQAFEPYVTSKPKGTGLGLAIVKKLVEEHGGQINARNREQGGAEISILIPICSRRGRAIAHSAPRPQERTRMSARILVVDDEANIRALIDEILSEEGYDVTTAADAKEARGARKRQEFDLILLDIWMPDTDGISLLREWSEGGSTGTVVMMSGHGTVDTAVEATRLGAVDFVEKPVSLAKLLRTVERALAVAPQQGATARRSRRRMSCPPARASRCVRCASRSLASRSTTRTRCSRASPAAAASCSPASSRARARRHAARSSPSWAAI